MIQVAEVKERAGLTDEQLVAMLRTMVQIREFELTVREVYQRGLMPGLAHLYAGEEAVAVGACTALRPTDRITSTHRGHGHCIAKGGDLKLMMAELMGRAPGYCHGKGGSMHIADLDLGILGANGVVGGGFGLATGSALTAKMQGCPDVTLCFFGDGGANQGIFHESINLASIWQLPVVYLCENNGYGLSMPPSRSTHIKDIAERAAAYGIQGVSVDGNDVLAVYTAVSEAVENARSGGGPGFIECKTYRWFGHHVGDPGTDYRTDAEVKAWKERDPVEHFRQWLDSQGILSLDVSATMTEEVRAEIKEAAEFGEHAPYPDKSEVSTDVYA